MAKKRITANLKLLSCLNRFHLFYAPIVVIGLIASLIMSNKFLSAIFGALTGFAFVISLILNLLDRKV